MKRIWAQCIKELVQFQRDRLTVMLAFVLPLITLLIFGFALRLEAKNIPLVVQDFDQSQLSRIYIERVFATTQFKSIPLCSPYSPIEYKIDQGAAKAVLMIPANFGRSIKAGKTSQVQILIDGTDINNARIIKNSIQATTNFFLNSQGLQLRKDRVVANVRLWFNPGRQESLYIIPGVYALVLSMYPALLAAMAMVREKEQGTIIQVYASSLTATELLFGKGLAYLLVAISEALFIMAFGSLLFGLQLVGDLTALLIGTLIFLITNVLFGLLIGVEATTQSVAVQEVPGFLTSEKKRLELARFRII